MRARGMAKDEMAQDLDMISMVLLWLGMWKAGELVFKTAREIYYMIKIVRLVLGSLKPAQQAEARQMLDEAKQILEKHGR